MSGGYLKCVQRVSVGCLVGVCRVFGSYLEGIGKCPEGLWRMSGWCLHGDRMVSGGCQEVFLRMSLGCSY